MIPALTELARRLGVSAVFVPIALAVALTGIVFLVPTVFRWFDDRKS
jgi:hypothetical protein